MKKLTIEYSDDMGMAELFEQLGKVYSNGISTKLEYIDGGVQWDMSYGTPGYETKMKEINGSGTVVTVRKKSE